MPLAFWLARRQRHRYPHFECTTAEHSQRCGSRDPELNEPAIGHVCSCTCKDCSLLITDPNGERVEVCICRGCDVHACGMHRSLLGSG